MVVRSKIRWMCLGEFRRQVWNRTTSKHLACDSFFYPSPTQCHELSKISRNQVKMLSSGFTNAPITRLLVIGTVLSAFLASITDTKYYFWIQPRPHLFDYWQFWRLLTWQLCYTNSTEVLFAAMTFYQLRVIERLWGSRKFAVGLLQNT